VEGTTASGVETGHLAEVGVVLDCMSKNGEGQYSVLR
jgi:hypothetical protein